MPRAGLLLLACAAIATAAVSTAFGARAGSKRIYPPALRSHGGALKACPSQAGLERFGADARARARKEALGYSSAGRARDLANSDRAWQPSVGSSAPSGQAMMLDGAGPAARSGYAIIVRHSCGARLLKRSYVVAVGPAQAPGTPHCVACISHFFLLDRRGRALIYFIY